MSAKFQAAEDIKKLARSLKGLVAFADEIEKVGSLEQAENEIKRRVENLKKDEEGASAKLQHVIESIALAEDKAKHLVLAAESKAKKIADDADAKADEAVHQAEYLAKKLVYEAQEKASELAKRVKFEADKLELIKADAQLFAEKKLALSFELEALKKKFS